MFKLVIQDDEGKTTVVPLIRDEITIGRKEGNTIRLTERNVSRRHARILRNAGEVHIEDLGSYNGIRVNNARIAERVSLRVSDQVQIGDYKLYLKAEGVEQVDDARTMPIERVDTNNSATEVMNAVPPASTPAAPAPLTAAPAPQMVGNPNRTLVAIADTDPQGRPVATGVTAAAVAALSAPVGYGKLVVVSSNFAGKEYELSRPQMIVGRTDENDIVVNHRSISRNHAKLVREPDTGRYTISDLQSSNGVRVNGQDYGKVELRRGDVVDLGHVRLRFVEPGEDFVFSRDAVITDVPDSGSKKGLLVAIVLGVIVVGAVGAFFMFKNNGDDKQVSKPPGDRTDINGSNGGGSGTDVATNPNSGQMIPDATPDAATMATNPTIPTDEVGKGLYAKCVDLVNQKNWPQLQNCGNELGAHDQAAGNEFLTKAAMENRSSAGWDKLKDIYANKNHTLKDAAAAMARIDDNSVYAKDAKSVFLKLTDILNDDAHKRLATQAEQHNCKNFDKLVDELKKSGIANPAGDLHCEAATTIAEHPVEHPIEHPIEHPVEHPHNPDHVKDPGPGSATVTPPPPPCNATAYKNAGDADYMAGNFVAAEVSFKKAYECSKDTQILSRAYQSACKASRGDDARQLFHMLPLATQTNNANLLQICMANNIDPRK